MDAKLIKSLGSELLKLTQQINAHAEEEERAVKQVKEPVKQVKTPTKQV